MDNAEVQSNIHDDILGFVLEKLKEQFPDLEVVRADSRELGARFKALSQSPVVLGYRPDAYCISQDQIVMVEVKSEADFNSRHSIRQYHAALRIISSVENWCYLVVVFGRRAPQLMKSEIMEQLLSHPRFALRVLTDGTERS